MRTLFLSGIATVGFILCNSFTISPNSQKREIKKTEQRVNDADWGKLHSMIEQSSVDTVKANFDLFVRKNSLRTTALKSGNGDYFGITPTDDFGYLHLVFIKINQGKIITIHYDELKSNGKSKRTDSDYNRKMSVSGTTPSVAYPSYEEQLLKKQDYMKVDAVTGATYSLYRFRMAVAKALEKSNNK